MTPLLLAFLIFAGNVNSYSNAVKINLSKGSILNNETSNLTQKI